MQLLNDELRQQIPTLYATEDIETKDKQVIAKFFFPAGVWTWFVVEGSEQENDFIFFGYVVGDFPEWGYFSLSELEGINVHGLTVERDLSFKPGKFKEVIDQFWKERS
jgi:hypothetical protein